MSMSLCQQKTQVEMVGLGRGQYNENPSRSNKTLDQFFANICPRKNSFAREKTAAGVMTMIIIRKDQRAVLSSSLSCVRACHFIHDTRSPFLLYLHFINGSLAPFSLELPVGGNKS